MRSHPIRLTIFAIGFLLLPASTLATFTDVETYHPYEHAISNLQLRGAIGGYSDGTFRPANTINRAEFTKIVTGILFNQDTQYQECRSKMGHGQIGPDIVRDSWYEIPVCFAMARGIVQGYPDGTFRPEQPINFAEAAKIVAETFDLAEGPPSEPWYRRFVEGLEKSYAIPVSITRFDQPLTRAEVAAMLNAVIAKDPGEPSLTYAKIAGGRADGSLYRLIAENMKKADREHRESGHAFDYSDAHFDGCGKMSTYAEESWFTNLVSRMERDAGITANDEQISEGCYASDASVFIFLMPGTYCGGGRVFRYNTVSGEIEEASVNDGIDGCNSSISAFGKRTGSVIPLTGGWGDAGCSSRSTYDYDFVRNAVRLRQTCSWCQDEPEVCTAY